MNHVVALRPMPVIPVAGGGLFPVQCIDCAGRDDVEHAAIESTVNGTRRQAIRIARMIRNAGELIGHRSAAWTRAPGELFFTGTLEPVAAVVAGDPLVAQVDGLPPLDARIVEA